VSLQQHVPTFKPLVEASGPFWAFILAFFQGIFWPAWMVYHVFKVLHA
jgi:hypothetical protein